MRVLVGSNMGLSAQNEEVFTLLKKARKQNPDAKIYIFGSTIHNPIYLKQYEDYNYEVVEDLKEIRRLAKTIKTAVVIFSSEGVEEEVEATLKERKIKYYDATYTRTRTVRKNIKKQLKTKRQVIYLGDKDAYETKVTLSISDKILFIDANENDLSSYEIKKNAVVYNSILLDELRITRILSKIREKQSEIEYVENYSPILISRQNNFQEVGNQKYLVLVGNKNSTSIQGLLEYEKVWFPDRPHLIFASPDEVLKFVEEYGIEYDKGVFINSGTSTTEEETLAVADCFRKLKKPRN
jgi:4-hydroxy-3-methylbut-2-enyl diphosphate reductase IspH